LWWFDGRVCFDDEGLAADGAIGGCACEGVVCFEGLLAVGAGEFHGVAFRLSFSGPLEEGRS
jgi:hypothetical protein